MSDSDCLTKFDFLRYLFNFSDLIIILILIIISTTIIVVINYLHV